MSQSRLGVIVRFDRNLWIERRVCPVKGGRVRMVVKRGRARCPACGRRVLYGVNGGGEH